MKKRTQVRRNSSIAAAHSQPKTPRGEDGLGSFRKEVDYPSCLCLFDRVANSVSAKVPLTDDELMAALTEADRAGVYPAQFVADAIRGKLHRSRGDRSGSLEARPGHSIAEDEASHLWKLVDGLEQEVAASNGLIGLLIDSKDPNSSAAEVALSEQAFNGICQLYGKINLREQFEAVQDYCQSLLHRGSAAPPGN
jgi:hypothetical protein